MDVTQHPLVQSLRNAGGMDSYFMAPISRIFGTLLMSLVLAMAACSGNGNTGPVQPAQAGSAPEATAGERVLRAGLPFLFTNQPPDPARGGGFHLIQTGLGETLFKLSQDLRPEPWLATGAEYIDERTWRVTLHQGVVFHNGKLMDAAAVKASLERAISKSPTSMALLDIERIEVNDPLTLTIATNRPSPVFPGMLTDPSSVILDAADARAGGDDVINENPVLTGPFKWERFQTDRELVVVRHQEYWGTPPSVDRAVFLYIPDNNSRVLALQSGDIDIASYIAPESVPTVEDTSNLAVVPAAPVALEFMYLNLQRTPWEDGRVREAVALAINREALVNAVMQGLGTAATGPFPPAFLMCPQLQGHPFDPVSAKQLLAQAGYLDMNGDGLVERDGQTLTMTLLTYRQRPELPPMAEAIQGSLKTIGIKVDVRMVEQINPALEGTDWDSGMYFNNMATTGDPYWALSQFFATGGDANRGGYSSPRVDELTRQVEPATDQLVREQFACEASQIVVDEVAVV
ncbi:MAG TPA: ABC transporter substrate-binding protein, partial [Dehalococcoidia bacterium]|nr:ABC transporter substrate-binding protein [Dehalococcoidia bacterium]